MNDYLLLTKPLIAGGAIGPLLFILVFLVAGATRPGYSAWHNFVSELSLGKQGWVQIANFLVCGLLMLCFAVGLQQVPGLGTGAVWVPILFGIFGLALILSGLFVGDPNTLHGMIHGIAGILVFSSLAIASFVLAWHFVGDPAWRGWALYSLATGIVVAVFFIATSVVSSLDQKGILPGSPTGLLQRIAIIAGWGWIVLLALRLLSL